MKMKYIAFILKFTEVTFKKKKRKLNYKSFIPESNKHLIMFDLLQLSYIRTFLVDVKSGFNNSRSEDNYEVIEKDKKENFRLNIKRNKRKSHIFTIEEDDSSEESEKI